MADYTRRERHIIRTEYALPSETVWAEVNKVFARIRSDLGEDAARWDDAATVEARDDEIVIWYEREANPVPAPDAVIEASHDGKATALEETAEYVAKHRPGHDELIAWCHRRANAFRGPS